MPHPDSTPTHITEHDTGLGANLFFEYPVAPAEPFETAAYRAVRARHHFLTDDNHAWSAVRRGPRRLAIVVTRNERSPEPLGLGGPLPTWVPRGPGSSWFTVNFFDGPLMEARNGHH